MSLPKAVCPECSSPLWHSGDCSVCTWRRPQPPKAPPSPRPESDHAVIACARRALDSARAAGTGLRLNAQEVGALSRTLADADVERAREALFEP